MAFFDFFRPQWKHSNPKIRMEAVRSLAEGSHSALREIILHDRDANIRKLAIKKYNDPKTLNDFLADIQELNIKQIANERICQLFAERIIGAKDFASAIGELVYISQPRHLMDVVYRAILEPVRYAAVKKISDFLLLSELVLSSKDKEIVNLAIEQIQEDGQLRELVLRVKDKDLMVRLVSRLNDQRLLDDLILRGNKALKQVVADRKKQTFGSNEKAVATTGSLAQHRVKKEKLCHVVEGALLIVDLETASKTALSAKVTFDSLGTQPGDEEIDKKFQQIFQRFVDRLSPKVDEKKTITREQVIANTSQKFSEPKKVDEVSATVKNSLVQDEGFNLVQAIENLSITDYRWKEKLAKLESQFELFQRRFPSSKEWIEPFEFFKARFLENHARHEEDKKAAWVGQSSELQSIVDEFVLLEKNHHLSHVESEWKRLSSQGKNLVEKIKDNQQLKRDFEEAQKRILIHLRQLKEAKSWNVWASSGKKEELYAALLALKGHNEIEPFEMLEKLKGLKREFIRLTKGPHDHKLRELSANFEREYKQLFSIWEPLFQSSIEQNIRVRQEICKRLEEIILKPFTKEERKQGEALIAEWKQAGFVPKDSGRSIFERFKQAHQIFWQKQKEWKQSQATLSKEAERTAEGICSDMEQIASSPIVSLRDANGKVAQLRQRWKSLGFIPQAFRRPLWERFKQANELFLQKKMSRIKELEGLWKNREEQKNAICDEIERLINDPVKTFLEPEKKLKEFIERFDGVGSLGRQKDEAMGERFTVACKKYMAVYLGRFENKLPLDDLRRQFSVDKEG